MRPDRPKAAVAKSAIIASFESSREERTNDFK